VNGLLCLALATLSVAGRTSATPSIAVDGRFVAVVWSAADPQGATDVYAAISRDAGVNFGAPVRVTSTGDVRVSGEQPPKVALVHRNGEPAIVVAWTARTDRTVIRTARSDDGGRTFAASGTIESPAAAGMRGWESLVADRAGVVHAVWLDHRDMAAKEPAAGAMHHATGQSNMARLSAIYHARVGENGTAEAAITHGVCYCCKTALAIGPHGELYAAWRHVYDGNVRDIAFAASTDDGRTFSTPVRISEDGWILEGCPDDGPSMVVDPRGTVHVVWPTLVPTPEPHVEIFYASSADGRTFTPRQRVETLGSPKPSHPQIARLADGRLAVAWDEIVHGTRVAAVRLVTPRPGGRLDQATLVSDLFPSPALYPVLAATPDGAVAVAVTGRELTVGIIARQTADGRKAPRTPQSNLYLAR